MSAFLPENAAFLHPWTENQLRQDILTRLDSENYVYTLHESVIGYIFGWVIENEYHLNNIAVHPTYRRKNIARSLINHVISILIHRKIQLLFLEVNINNNAAQKCYESLGFVNDGMRKKYYTSGEDALLYTLRINPNG